MSTEKDKKNDGLVGKRVEKCPRTEVNRGHFDKMLKGALNTPPPKKEKK